MSESLVPEWLLRDIAQDLGYTVDELMDVIDDVYPEHLEEYDCE